MWHTAIATALRNQRSNVRAFPWNFTLGHIIDGAYLVLVAYFSYVYLIQGDLDDRFAMYTGTTNYLAFAIIGGTLNVFSVSMMMNVSRAMITEWREGTLEALLLSPSSRAGYFLGTAVQQFYRSGIVLAAVLACGLLAGLALPSPHLLSVAVAAMLFILSTYAMALVLGSVMLLTRDTYIVQNTLFAVTTLLCGFQFPGQYLPRALQAAAEIFPLTSSLKLLRGTLLTGSTLSYPDILPALVLSLIYITAGMWCIHKVERGLFEKF